MTAPRWVKGNEACSLRDLGCTRNCKRGESAQVSPLTKSREGGADSKNR